MINKILKQLKPKVNGKILYLSQYGSHLYGLNTENSDLDFRGVYIPILDDIILHKDKDEINEELEIEVPLENAPTANTLGNELIQSIGQRIRDNKLCITDGIYTKKKVDIKIFSLQKFITLCSKADTNALDLLFSMDSKHVPYYLPEHKDTDKEFWSIMRRIHLNRDRLINTDRLESPITYAFKQAQKYSIKGTRYKIMQDILVIINRILYNDYGMPIYENKNLQIKDCIKEFECFFDNKHVKIDKLDNKGKLEKYLYICGVQHQFNLPITTLANRIEEKIDKEYTSQRTKDAVDGNDWKSLSHALRVLLEVKELLSFGTINFPLKDSQFLLNVKLGKIDRDAVDSFFEFELSTILENVQANKLGWKYDEEFWNRFILSQYLA